LMLACGALGACVACGADSGMSTVFSAAVMA